MSETALEQSIFGDMASLETSLSEDASGDKARAMVDYFKNIATATEAMLGDARDEAQRHLISRLLSGFYAAQRIVRHVWETIHGMVLVG